MHLGSFGAAMRELDPQAEKDTFDYFGATFTVHANIPPVTMWDLAAAVTGNVGDIEGMAAAREAMRYALTKPERKDGDETIPADDAEFERWHALAASKRDSNAGLIKLALALFEVQSGRPTVQRSDSSDGPLPTSTNSNAPASTHPDLQGFRPVGEVLAG